MGAACTRIVTVPSQNLHGRRAVESVLKFCERLSGQPASSARFNFHARVRYTMSDMLEGFMAYLENNGLVEFDMRNEGESGLNSRHRLQWYVFLAKRFGLDMHYEYDMYLYGPQSRALMGDYVRYTENHAGSSDSGVATAQIVIRLPESFRSGEFLDFVKGRDDDWLEMATTLMDRNEDIKKRDNLIRNVEWTTHEVPMEYIEGVLGELQAAHMVDLEQ